MSNYYQVRGYKHTGFNYLNRPLDREVLNGPEFTSSNNMFDIKGIVSKRDDMFGMSYIDLQGSVKDYDGSQENAANSTGVHGPGGPFYSIEEIDYLRVTRTGYPGDVDFVDVSGNIDDPWQSPHEGKKLFIAYYFVTGCLPLSRDVTRVYVDMDIWTTLGGREEMSIDTGMKTRGHITVSEDASTLNLAEEDIKPIEPIRITGYKRINTLSGDSVDLFLSGSWLAQYRQIDQPSMDGVTAQGEGGVQIVIPYIIPSPPTRFLMTYPELNTSVGLFDGLGAYEVDEQTRYNIALLYSAGQLELMDSYTIPAEYANKTTLVTPFVNILGGKDELYANAATVDLGSYPRKAYYMDRQVCIMSESNGTVNMQPVANLSNGDVHIWSCPMPGGTPYARFENINNSVHPYDQSIAGAPWLSKSVVLEGGSGTYWATLNNAFSQQTLDRDVRINTHNNRMYALNNTIRSVNNSTGAMLDAASLASSGASAKNYLSGGKETVSALRGVVGRGLSVAQQAVDVYGELKAREFRQEGLDQEQQQLNAKVLQTAYQSPTVSFIPTVGSSAFAQNVFSTFVADSSANDIARKVAYLLRYGYRGLYKQLTWDTIAVKKRVNYVEAEGVSISHPHYPVRVAAQAATLISQGVFLWSEKPKQSAFADNPDA